MAKEAIFRNYCARDAEYEQFYVRGGEHIGLDFEEILRKHFSQRMPYFGVIYITKHMDHVSEQNDVVMSG